MTDADRVKQRKRTGGGKGKKKKAKSRKKKAVMIAPFFVALAPNLPTAIATATAPFTTAHFAQTAKPAPASDGYVFAGPWWQFASDVNDRTMAIRLAESVVDLAFERAGAPDVPTIGRRPLIQWILIGEMSPDDVKRTIAAPDEAAPFFEELVARARDIGRYGESNATALTEGLMRPVVVAGSVRARPGRPLKISRSSIVQWLETHGDERNLRESPSAEPYTSIDPPSDPDGAIG